MKHKITRLSGLKPVFIIPVFLLIATAFFYSSCNKFSEDYDFSKVVKPGWNPEFAIPLVNSTLYIADFMEDSSNLNIVTNPDQSLSFIYSGDSIFSAEAGTFVNIPDQDFEFPESFTMSPLAPGEYDTLSFTQQYQFIADSVNQRIDSLFLDDGLLNIYGQTTLNRDKAELRLTIPDIKHKQSGTSLTIITTLDNPGGQSAIVYFDTTYNMDEYKIVLNDPSDTTKNAMTFLLNIFIEGDNNPNLSPYDFIVGGSLTDLEFGSAFGYFGQYKLDFADSLEIGLFEDAITGGVSIGDGSVKLSLDLHNSIGTPVSFKAETLKATSEYTPPYQVDIELFGPGIPNTFDIVSPNIDQMGEYAETHLDFTQANFSEAFNISPNWLHYDFRATTNAEQDSTVQNFLLSESRIVFDIDLEFQLYASLAAFTIEDTVALDFNENPDEIDWALFRLNLTNGFPIQAGVQAYFADENYQVLDSLMDADNTVLLGAPTSGAPDYKVTEPINKITDIMIDDAKLENIVNSKYLLFKVGLSTTDEDFIKIYDDYNVVIKLGTIVGLTVGNNN